MFGDRVHGPYVFVMNGEFTELTVIGDFDDGYLLSGVRRLAWTARKSMAIIRSWNRSLGMSR